MPLATHAHAENGPPTPKAPSSFTCSVRLGCGFQQLLACRIYTAWGTIPKLDPISRILEPVSTSSLDLLV